MIYRKVSEGVVIVVESNRGKYLISKHEKIIALAFVPTVMGRLYNVVPRRYCMLYGQHFHQSMDQPDMAANPARGQLNREN